MKAGATGAAMAALLLVVAGPAGGQQARIVSSAITVTSQAGGRAVLEVELADGTQHAISFQRGAVRVDGRTVGGYEAGGALEEAWRALLSRHVTAAPETLAEALLAWEPSGLPAEEAETAAAVGERVRDMLRMAPAADVAAADAETVTVTAPGGGQLSIAPGRLSFEALTAQLERLQGSIGELGEAAEEARERLALIVHDDYQIAAGRTVPGNLALLGGTLALGGAVEGDVLLLDGTLVLEPSARIEGDLLQVGGQVEEAGGRIAGEILSLRPAAPGAPAPPATVAPAPERATHVTRVERRHRDRGFFDRIGRNIGRAVEGISNLLGLFIVLGLLGCVAVYFARPKLEAVADTARYDFPRSFGMGLAAGILLIPLLVILCVTVIGIPLAALLALATPVAMAAGYLAVAHAVGEAFAARRYRYEWLERLRRSNSYYYVLSGLVVLLLPFALAAALWVFGGFLGFLRWFASAVGWILVFLAVTSGLGALLLTRGGTRGAHARGGFERPGPDDPWTRFWSRRRRGGPGGGGGAAGDRPVDVQVEPEEPSRPPGAGAGEQGSGPAGDEPAGGPSGGEGTDG